MERKELVKEIKRVLANANEIMSKVYCEHHYTVDRLKELLRLLNSGEKIDFVGFRDILDLKHEKEQVNGYSLSYNQLREKYGSDIDIVLGLRESMSIIAYNKDNDFNGTHYIIS